MGLAAVRAALLLAAVLAVFYAVPSAGSAAQPHGRELVARYELPAELVALYRAQAASGMPARSARASSADPLQWLGPTQSVGAGRNPYRLVLSVSGIAPLAGDVRTHWQAGWEVHESPAATRDLLMAVAALSSGRVGAGTPLTLTVVGSPVTFRGEREAAPMLNLVQAQNFEIERVQLAVWSGEAPWAWPQLSPPRMALLLLGVLCATAWFALRQRPLPTPAPSVAAPVSTLPPSPAQLLARASHTAPAPRGAALPPRAAAPTAAATSVSSQVARAVAALRDVLGTGLAVPTEFDDARKPRRGLRAR